MNGAASGYVCAVDRDLALLHRLEQRRLRLRRRAVDLVGEHDVGEHAAGAELELAGGAVPDRHAGDVGGQQVGGELDAVPGAADRAGDRLGQRRLADAGDVLDEEVALGEQAHEREVDLLALALDHAARRCRRSARNRPARTTDARGSAPARSGCATRTPSTGPGVATVPERSSGRSAPRRTGRVRVRPRDGRAPGPAVARRRGSGCGAVAARARAPVAVADRAGARPAALARPRLVAARRRSSRCPTPTTSGSGSRPSTAARRRARARRPRRLPASGAATAANPAPDGAELAPVRLAASAPDDRRRSRRLGRALLLNASFEPLCVVLDAAGRGAGPEGEGRDRRAQRRRAPLRAAARARADGDPPAPLRAGARTAAGCRSRAGPSSPATATAASTATGRPRTSTTSCPAPGVASTAWENVVASCRPCNARKENRLLAETDLRLRRRPVAPHATLWVDRHRRLDRPRLGALPPRLEPRSLRSGLRTAEVLARPNRRPVTRASGALFSRRRGGKGARCGLKSGAEGCRVPRSGVKW